ncbi:MAG: 6-phosphogluconolactonase, eukaryotic type [Ktedonobacterales bacterium]|jgi:6-phosphogluconolactonase|nr:MAG: 6-phosphogluconolactonase, eukaryotic type [Ktedonobacterales bacterium]
MSNPDSTQRGRIHRILAPDVKGVARYGAELFVRLSQIAAANGRFSVALSGGSTPRTMHLLLASPEFRTQVNWSYVHFYWGDERCVPPEDQESNFRMARETLLDALPVQPAQIHRIRSEDTPESAAAQYENELRETFRLAQGEWPRFDLIYLGMGPDGHTASLFPHTTALHVSDRIVVANYVPKLAASRITLTVPVLNNAAAVAFLVAGAEKASALAAVIDGPPNPDEYPSQRIAPSNGDLYWIMDRAASAHL